MSVYYERASREREGEQLYCKSILSSGSRKEREEREGKGENIYHTSILSSGSRRELAGRGKVKTSIIQIP